ncbi:MAG: hypothetical protein ACJ79A_00705 [Gemmatimonadaceae bacterium]
MSSFFLHDFFAGFVGTLLLSVLLGAPGYLLAFATDVWHFRSRSMATRAAASLVLAIAVVPGSVFLVARFTSLAVAAALLVLAALVGAVVAVHSRAGVGPRQALADPLTRRVLIAAGVWIVLALLLLSDLQIGRSLYPNIVAYDYAKHISVTDAVRRTGVPPLNPSLRLGDGIVLYYYYFWFLVCALGDFVGGPFVGARGAVFGGTAIAGLALMSVVALYARLLFVNTASVEERRRAIRISVALLLVGGLDITLLPYALARGGRLPLSLDWLNEQVTMWPNSALWVPHHVASLIAGLTAFLVLLDAPRHSARRRAVLVVVAGLAIASGVGLSIWVTFAFAIFWLLWVLVSLVRGRALDASLAVVAGAIGVLAAAPFLWDLARAGMLHSAPVVLWVRAFAPLDDYLDAIGAGDRRRLVFRFAALPLNYALELGFFAVASGGYWWRRRRSAHTLDRGETGVILIAVTGLLVGSFVQSAIRSNDLGWRALMLAQFAALIWSGQFVASLLRERASRASDTPRRGFAGPAGLALLSLLLAIGLASSAYDLVMSRVYLVGARADGPWASVKVWGPGGAGTAYDVREAYAWANHALPPTAVIQANPKAPVGLVYLRAPVDVFAGLYASRQAIAGDAEYGTLYGVPKEIYDRVANPIARVFSDSASDGTLEAAQLCRRLGIRAWLVTVADSVFHDRRSWVWREPALFSNRTTRVLGCPQMSATQWP